MAAWREQRMRALANGEAITKQFRAETTSTGTGAADIYLYDVIDSWGGYWGISASDIVAALQGVGDVTVHINSPGGEVFEALAIYATFRNHAGAVTMHVDGYAASAASVVAMAGGRVVMEPNAMMMIHDAWDIAIGNEADLVEAASLLGKASQNLATIYQAKAGGTADEWRDAMRPKDTWYTADEALAAGLADEINQPTGTVDPVEAAGFGAAWDAARIQALYETAPAPTTPPAVGAGVPAAPAATINNTMVTIPGWDQFRAGAKGLKR